MTATPAYQIATRTALKVLRNLQCLNMEWFRSRSEAKVIIEAWRKQYNQIRPHSSLEYLTPNEFIKTLPNTASQQAIL